MTLSPLLGLLMLHALSTGSTTPTTVDWQNISNPANYTTHLYEPLPISTKTSQAHVAQLADPVTPSSTSKVQEASAERIQSNNTGVSNNTIYRIPQPTKNTSLSDQPRTSIITITKPDVSEKVSITTSTATTTTPSLPATTSTTAPPLKNTAKMKTALITVVLTTLPSTNMRAPKPTTTHTPTTTTPTTTTTTTTTLRSPTTSKVLPQITNLTSPPPRPPLTTQTITTTAQKKPSPTTQKTLNPPTASENPVALPTSPDSVTKGLASSTNKTVVGVTIGPFRGRLVDTSSLLAVLLFGLLFFVVTVVLFLTQAYESYRRKDYTQVDYLINGMYSDSGV